MAWVVVSTQQPSIVELEKPLQYSSFGIALTKPHSAFIVLVNCVVPELAVIYVVPAV